MLGWTDREVLAQFGGGLLSLIVFIIVELRTAEPMLPLFLFRNRSFSGASLPLTMAVFGMAGSIFFLSQYLQTILGYDTLRAGFGTLPLAVGLFVAAPMSTSLSKRFGIRAMVAAGIGIAGCSLLAVDPRLPKGVADQIVATANSAFVQGMSNAMIIGAVMMGLSVLFVLLVLPAQVKENQGGALIAGKVSSAGD